MEHFYHVPRRIRAGITRGKRSLGGYSGYFGQYNTRFWKSDHTIRQSSSSCTWNLTGTFLPCPQANRGWNYQRKTWFGRLFGYFGQYNTRFWKSDDTIGQSSSSCTWNKNGTFGTCSQANRCWNYSNPVPASPTLLIQPLKKSLKFVRPSQSEFSIRFRCVSNDIHQ